MQGKLYLYESASPGAKLAAAEAVWAADRRVVRVPAEQIGGAEHVVALCPGEPFCCCYSCGLRWRSEGSQGEDNLMLGNGWQSAGWSWGNE